MALSQIYSILSISIDGIKNNCRIFIKNTAGVAAVEFALMLPVMLTVWLGSVEVDNALRISRRVEDAARILSDLSTQVNNIDSTTLTSITNAAEALMWPVNSEQLAYRLTSIGFFGGQAKVCWVYQKPGKTLTRPLKNRGDIVGPEVIETKARTRKSVILAEVEYTYMPKTSWLFTGQRNYRSQVYMDPRLGDFVSFYNSSFNSGLPVGGSC